jgi:hypothetical protein
MPARRLPNATPHFRPLRSFSNKRRVYGGEPVYIKVGKRVGYDRVDLELWLANKKVANTSQAEKVGQ